MSIPLTKTSRQDKKEKFERLYKIKVSECQCNYYDAEMDQEMCNNYYKKLHINEQVPHWEEIHSLLSSTYIHAKRKNLFPYIDRQPDGRLKCCYSNEIVESRDCIRTIKCNEEHCVPQSWHSGSLAGIGRDMHMLFCWYVPNLLYIF